MMHMAAAVAVPHSIFSDGLANITIGAQFLLHLLFINNAV